MGIWFLLVGEDGRRRYCYAVSLEGEASDQDQGLLLCLSSCYPVLQVLLYITQHRNGTFTLSLGRQS